MILKKILTVMMVLIASWAFGQTNTNRGTNRKSVNSTTVKSSDSNLVEKKRNATASKKHELISGKEMPADFPKYQDTGNKEKDMADYLAAKEKWVRENPERYQEYFRQKK